MSIAIQCPNPACGTAASVPDAIAGHTVKCKRCGTPFIAKPTLSGETTDTHPAAATLDPFRSFPATFGRYKVLKLLGKGGMGSVYLAEDTQLGRKVALKLPAFAPGEAPRRVERFVREARSAAGLSHPNICTVYDAGQIDGRPFLSMAYLNGRTLDDAIDPDAPLPAARAAAVARHVAHALAHAHAQGIIHRDLKPANVMLTAAGDPVVMDFGLAKRVTDPDTEEAKLTRDGAVMGTPTYMSPEQVRGEAVGPAADVYALGVMLFEMLAGRPPYTGPLGVVMGQILHAPVPAVREFRPAADPVLEGICNRALAKDPAARFPTMAAFAAALDAYLAAPAAPVTAAPSDFAFDDEPPKPVRRPTATAVEDVPPARRKKAPARSNRGLILAALGGLAALLVGVAILLTVRTKHGDVVIELSDPSANVEVKVDGNRIDLVGLDKPLTLTAGEHGLTVTGPDFETVTQSFTVKKGEKQVVKASLKRKAVEAKGPEPKAKRPEPTETTPRVVAENIPGAGDWVSLFNGKDRTGWTVVRGQPDNWRVADGVLIAEGGPGKSHLATQEVFKNFHLRAEYRINAAGNSGIYFRVSADPAPNGFAAGGYEAQINHSGKKGPPTGSLYRRNQALATRSAGKPDEWTTMDVIAVGPRVVIRVNGEKVVDETDPDPVTDAGPIWLQQIDPETKIEFRSIRVRRVTDDAPAHVVTDLLQAPPAAAVPATDGFVPLFNGKDLTGWAAVGPPKWRWAGDRLVGEPAPGGGFLMTEATYDDFELELQYRLVAGMGSGLLLRGDPAGPPSGAAQLEVQIIDDDFPKWSDLAADKKTGSVFSVFARKADPAFKRNDWNTVRVRLERRKIQVWVNGTRTIDADLDDARDKFGQYPGLVRPSGRFGLQQNQQAAVEFREFKVKRLGEPAPKKAALPADATRIGAGSFKVYQTNLSWKDAKARCEALGGRLAVVKSDEANRRLTQLVAAANLNEAWIGATDEAEEGKWVWLDGTRLADGYTNWGRLQPNNKPPGEHYALIWLGGQGQFKDNGEWADQPDVSTQHQPGFVCEWPG